MSKARDEMSNLPLADVRRLVSFNKNSKEIQSLLNQRDEHLNQAQLIDDQIEFRLSGEHGKLQQRKYGFNVKELCIEALLKSKVGLTPTQIRNAILAQIQEQDKRQLYNSIYITLTKNPEFKKTQKGKFVLRKK